MTQPGVPQFTPPPSYAPPAPWTPGRSQPGIATAPANPYGTPVAAAPQRPAVIGMAATMAVTASLQWICVLSFAWLVATVGAAELDTSGQEGSLFHRLNRFHYRMLDGLAWPLYLLPLASFVLGFAILARQPWTRFAYTALGVLAIGWTAWLFRDDLRWWIVPAAYIAVATGIVWTRAATAWYRWAPTARPVTGPGGWVS